MNRDANRNDWREFFDQLAERWDEIAVHDPVIVENLLDVLELVPGEAVLDVGCGTGVLLPSLRRRIGPRGRLSACDLSARMLGRAKEKHGSMADRYLRGAVEQSVDNESYDAIVCYSVYPHFADGGETLKYLARRLREGGRLLIAHSQSRAAINALHSRAGGTVGNDRLPPASDVALLLKDAGLEPDRSRDDEVCWLVRGRKPASFRSLLE